MNETHYCEYCGATLAAEARFCEACGRAVSAPSAPAMPEVAAPSSATPRPSQPRWLIAGCVAAVVLIACIAAIAVGGFFFFQNTAQARATPSLIAIFSPSTPTRALGTVVVPPTLPAPAVIPTTAPSPTPPPTSIPTSAPTSTATPVRCQPITALSTSSGTIGPITFAPGATRDRQPIDPMTRFPEGVTEVYGIFAFNGMRNGTPVREEWCLDGNLRYEDSYAWNWGERGNTGSSFLREDGLPTGGYELRWYIANQLAQYGAFTIEKRQAGAPFFGPIRFAEGIQSNQPVNLHTRMQRFKAGTKEIYGFYDGGNLTTGLTIRWEWYRDGVLYIKPQSVPWPGGAMQNLWSSLVEMDRPLPSGTYELKLYINDQLVQLGTVIVEP